MQCVLRILFAIPLPANIITLIRFSSPRAHFLFRPVAHTGRYCVQMLTGWLAGFSYTHFPLTLWESEETNVCKSQLSTPVNGLLAHNERAKEKERTEESRNCALPVELFVRLASSLV